MMLPADFQFSQACLQDFEDCPKRFYLHYIAHLAWPAVENEPMLEHERQMRVGEMFHRLVHCQHLGIPEERLNRMASSDAELLEFWNNYLIYRPAKLPGDHYPEMTLTTALEDYRVVAKYDLLVVEAGVRATILDWKTSQHRSRDTTLQSRLQTSVYRWLLISAGAYLNSGVAIDPAQVQMIYWFAHYPESPLCLPYDHSQYRQDTERLSSLIKRIVEMDEHDFYLTEDVKRCAFCGYRSYCGRGIKAEVLTDAGALVETDTLEDLNLDFEQIAEIEF